jgi:hypothetical protein
MSAQPIYVVGGGKDPWPDPPPDPPGSLTAGPWAAHTLAYIPNGLGDIVRAPVVTVLTPGHFSTPA